MGKSTCERANEIVKLAHPKFRDSLMAEARKMCLA
jgi:acyl-CoA hydrolase